jgi:hypothetical protein
MKFRRATLAMAATSCFAVPIGVTAVIAPIAAFIASAALVLAGTLASLQGSRAARPFLILLGALLWGYMFLGRGFAHLGVGHIYVGDVVLILGLLTLATRPSCARLPLQRSVPLLLLLVLFIAWGSLRTSPYVERYGLVSLRDAAIWGYASFALLVVLMRDGPFLVRVLRWYRATIPVLLVWMALAQAAQIAGVTSLYLKPGDIAIHLVGIGAFLMLGLHQVDRMGSRASWQPWIDVGVWVLWCGNFLFVAARSRGGGLALIVTLIVVATIDRSHRIAKPVAIGFTLLLVVMLLNIRLGTSDGREISTNQFAANFSSIVRESNEPDLVGTKNWRLEWWRRIVGYTLRGPHFWSGKGYGINLADDDGFQVTNDHSLRSPHNSHLTILARSGVPGLALWILFHTTFAWSLLSARRQANREARRNVAAVCVWLFALWLAMSINATFDVYLEGPQGAVWFWSVVGLGIAVISNPTLIDDQAGQHSRPTTHSVPTHPPQERTVSSHGHSRGSLASD